MLSALYNSQLTRAALLMQEPDPWSKYSSRERNVIDTLAETETDTYMLIRSGGGATIGSIDGYVFTTQAENYVIKIRQYLTFIM